MVVWEHGKVTNVPGSPPQTNEWAFALASEHRKWLANFDPLYARNWDRLLKNHFEAAITEADIRRMLERHGATVEPTEDANGSRRRPDFKCRVGQEMFYVEAKCILRETATAKTGIPDHERGLFAFKPLNAAIMGICRGKAGQCKDLDAPALVAIGTLHSTIAMAYFTRPWVSMLLTGQVRMEWTPHTQTSLTVADTEDTTELRDAAFLGPDDSQPVGFARRPISGLLLCGVGYEPPRVIGVLHPNPVHSFRPELLPGIDFGQVRIDGESGRLQVRWPERVA